MAHQQGLNRRGQEMAYRVIRALVEPFFSWRFNLQADAQPALKAPYIVIANHVTDLDFFLVGKTFKTPMGFVVSQTMLKNPLARYFLTGWLGSIAKQKGTADIGTAMGIMRRLKEGRNVCLFAEGNTSFDGRTGSIPAATGSLLRSVGAGLVTCRIEGGYFSLPRWGKGIRRGKTRCLVVGTYTAEALAQMSADSINSLLARDLYTDAYAEQQNHPVAFKGKHPARGMEHVLYLCPSCERLGSLSGHGDLVICGHCGLRARYAPFGSFSDSKPFPGIREWADWQKEQLSQRLGSAEDAVILMDVGQTLLLQGVDGTLSPAASGTLQMSGKMFSIGDISLSVADITGLEIYRKNTLLLTARDGRHFELMPKPGFNALKYRDLYRIIKKEQGQ